MGSGVGGRTAEGLFDSASEGNHVGASVDGACGSVDGNISGAGEGSKLGTFDGARVITNVDPDDGNAEGSVDGKGVEKKNHVGARVGSA